MLTVTGPLQPFHASLTLLITGLSVPTADQTGLHRWRPGLSTELQRPVGPDEIVVAAQEFDGFIVTSMVLPSRSIVRFYNKRGTAEQWIKEGKQATHWTRLSCHRFRANEVRLQLSVLAYNLGNLWRRLVLPPRIKRWSLTSLHSGW